MSIRDKVTAAIDRVVKAMEPPPAPPLPVADGPWKDFAMQYDGSQETVARFLNWIGLQGFDPTFVHYDSRMAPGDPFVVRVLARQRTEGTAEAQAGQLHAAYKTKIDYERYIRAEVLKQKEAAVLSLLQSRRLLERALPYVKGWSRVTLIPKCDEERWIEEKGILVADIEAALAPVSRHLLHTPK